MAKLGIDYVDLVELYNRVKHNATNYLSSLQIQAYQC